MTAERPNQLANLQELQPRKPNGVHTLKTEAFKLTPIVFSNGANLYLVKRGEREITEILISARAEKEGFFVPRQELASRVYPDLHPKEASRQVDADIDSIKRAILDQMDIDWKISIVSEAEQPSYRLRKKFEKHKNNPLATVRLQATLNINGKKPENQEVANEVPQLSVISEEEKKLQIKDIETDLAGIVISQLMKEGIRQANRSPFAVLREVAPQDITIESLKGIWTKSELIEYIIECVVKTAEKVWNTENLALLSEKERRFLTNFTSLGKRGYDLERMVRVLRLLFSPPVPTPTTESAR